MDILQKKDNLFWENVTTVASEQLVLPLFFSSLIEKNLESILPDDLYNYLFEIREINRNRNHEILRQINSIIQILNQNRVKYVLLKGSAIISGKLHKFYMDRMVGDIDILIPKGYINKAYQKLISNGYTQNSYENIHLTENIFERKHYDRLVHPDYICAVELHQNLLEEAFKYRLESTEIFKETQLINNKFVIPSKINLLKHSIYNWAYNDLGIYYNLVNFRTIYDIENFKYEGFLYYFKNNGIYNHYISLTSLFFDYDKLKYPLFRIIFKLQLASSNFNRFFSFFVNLFLFVSIFFNRIHLFITNRRYREKIFSLPVTTFKKLIKSLKLPY